MKDVESEYTQLMDIIDTNSAYHDDITIVEVNPENSEVVIS